MNDLTIDKLGNTVQNFLSSQYPAIAGVTSVFAAQPGGLPIDPSTFAGNPLLAIQAINGVADVAARVLGGQFYPTLIKASDLYEILLSGMPTGGMTSDQLAEFGKLRGSADEDFHNYPNELTATPANWWDMTASGNWTTHTTASDEIATSAQPSPFPRWNWRILPVQHLPILRSGLHPGLLPVDRIVSINAVQPALLATSTSGVSVKASSADQLSMVEQSNVSRLAIVEQSNAVVAPVARPLSMVASSMAISQLVSVSSTQAVEAEHLSVSFEYCLVNLSRAWWHGLFVATKGWYIPTYSVGDMAAGSSDGSVGQCPTIPTAMILVRNVSISGSWSEQDSTAIPSAASFGPISLIGRSIDSNLTISIPGMQVVGWMANILPVLPPMSDPNLGALGLQNTSNDGLGNLPTLAQGQQGPAVARLQGLLRAAIPHSTDITLAIDGNYGPTTVAAVQTFQQQNGISLTGLADEVTWQKLLGL